jgi:hypothetical protein
MAADPRGRTPARPAPRCRPGGGTSSYAWAGGWAAFTFWTVALPSRERHRRLRNIAGGEGVLIIGTLQLEVHAANARSALRSADEIVIRCAPSPIEITRAAPVREEIADVERSRTSPPARPCC